MADILVVDDRELNRALLSYLLTKAGHRVREAAGGQEAIDEATAHPPDLAIIDLAMPRVDGYAVAHAFRMIPALHDTPLLAVSAMLDMSPAEVRTRGFDRFFALPIEPADFVGQVNEFLLDSPAAT